MIIKPKEKLDTYDKIINFLDPKRNKKETEPTPNYEDQFNKKYKEFIFFGKAKPKAKPRVQRPTEAKIVEHNQLKLMFMNVNSIQSAHKRELTEMGIRNKNPDVIILAETKTAEEDPQFQPDGYWIVKEINRKAGAGGAMILAKENIDITIAGAENVQKEIQVVDFKFNEHLVIGVYRSPNPIGPALNHHKKLIKHLRKLIKSHPINSPFTITGDFNLPDLAACHFQPPLRNIDYTAPFDDRQESINQVWAEFFCEFDLIQHVTQPSRPHCSNVLDLLITPRDQDAPHYVDQNAFHNSFDHFPLMFTIQSDFFTEEIMQTRRVTGPNNIDRLEKRVGARCIADWCPTNSGEEIITLIQQELSDAYEEECPLIEIKPPPPGGHKSKETVKMLRMSNRTRWRLQNERMSERKYLEVKAILKKQNKFAKFMCKRDRQANDIKKFEIARKKDKNFYKAVKKIKSKSSNKIGPIRTLEGVLVSGKQQMATGFGAYHQKELGPRDSLPELRKIQDNSIYLEALPFNILENDKPFQSMNLNDIEKIQERWEILEELPFNVLGPDQFPNWFERHPDAPNKELTHNQAYFSPKFVYDMIKKAKRGSSAGPDGLPMIVYSACARHIAAPLSWAFNLINQTGEVPMAFRETKVKELYKKNDKTKMSNYRPISMSNHIGKIWERCVNAMLIKHLEENNLLSDKQEGFRPKRGTVTNLSKLWQQVTTMAEKHGALVEIWNFDLTKAFDRLDHKIVLDLLHKAGVGGYLGLCIEKWLTTRKQFVEIDIYRSEETEVKMSCVQGSVLGPTLWILYINTLLEKIESSGLNVEAFAYADDLSIIKHIENDKELKEMEQILNILEEWADDHFMTWSATKTQRLVLKHRGGREPRPPRRIFFNGKEIKPMESEEFKEKCESLGVIISKSLVFTDNIKRIVQSIKGLTSMMKRFFFNHTEKLLTKYYWAYIVPKITYCSQIWNPGTESLLRDINKAMKQYWRLNKRRGPNGGPPPNILPPSLLLILVDQIFVHKIIAGDSTLKFSDFFEICESATRQDGKLQIPKFRLIFNRYRMSFRGAIFYNALPSEYYSLPASLFKKAALDHILNNMEMYTNLTRNYKVIFGLDSEEKPNLPTEAGLKLLAMHERMKLKRLNPKNKPKFSPEESKNQASTPDETRIWNRKEDQKKKLGLNLTKKAALKTDLSLVKLTPKENLPLCLRRLL